MSELLKRAVQAEAVVEVGAVEKDSPTRNEAERRIEITPDPFAGEVNEVNLRSIASQ